MDTHRCARWSMPAPTTLVLSSCLVLAASTGCNQDDGKVTSIEVTIRSDFLVGDELSFVYVESLSANEEDVVQRAWLELDADCANGREGARLLGSIDVERREDDTAHLRLRGYHRNAGGEADLIAERRVDLRFDRGAHATVDLLRACAATPGDCDGGLCLPSTCTNASAVVTGAEGAKGLEDCLSRATVEPVIALPDAGVAVDDDEPAPPPAVAACGDEDGNCPDGCTRFEDADCTLSLTASCSSDAECRSGYCEHGVCCASRCREECMRCDLPDSLGSCSDVVAARASPRSEPAFTATCDARHVQVVDGSVSCMPDWAQCAAGTGYLSALVSNGCDTPLGTTANCAACGDACSYGYCSPARRCDARAQGILDIDATYTLKAGTALGNQVTLVEGATVRALGVMADPRFARTEIRLGLYADISNRQQPYELLATTSRVLHPTSNDLDGQFPSPLNGVLRVEGAIDPPVVVEQGRSYFIFAWAETDTWLVAQSTALLTCPVDAPTGSFPSRYQSAQSCSEDDVGIGVYAVVTPASP